MMSGQRMPTPDAAATGARSREADLLLRALAPHAPGRRVLGELTAAATVLDLPPGPVQPSAAARPVPSLWLLRHGSLAIGSHDGKGRFIESRRVFAGQWVDVFGAMCEPPAWFYEMHALEPCALLGLPLSTVIQAMATDDDAASAFTGLIAHEALTLRDGLRRQRDTALNVRVAQRILEATRADDSGWTCTTWRIDIPKQQLAQQLGASKEAFSRMLRSLSEHGLIRVDGYTITVLDRDGLAAVCRSTRRPRSVRHPPFESRHIEPGSAGMLPADAPHGVGERDR